VTNPIEVSKYVTEERWVNSVAEYEHHAFLFSKEKNLLVIPGYYNDYEKEDGDQSFNGVMIFNIDKNDIELRGIIDHQTSGNYYGSLVERSLYIEDTLYSKSVGMIKANNLDDLELISSVELDYRESYMN